MARKTLYIIDGHAQIYRAYYAPFGNLTSPTGEPTRAVHVFMQMTLGLLRDRRPDYLAMTMDVSDRSVFRLQIDPTYKANRDKMPEDLPPQIDRIVSLLTAMGVPILRETGFEADDLMATLCERFHAQDLNIVLVSKDKDLDQLLRDDVTMYDPGKDKELDTAAMIAQKGYGPEQAVEAQMLMGDSSDNIQGVTGVGPKKAAQLLKKYGTITSIIEHADELTPKLRENILAFRERMDLVRNLVTLRRDLDFEFNLENADTGRLDPAATVPILAELGLNRLIERVESSAGATTTSARATATSTEANHTEDPQTTSSPTNEKPPSPITGGLFDELPESNNNYELVDTTPSLAKLAQRLATIESFAFDTETTGLVPAAADLVGISISWETNTGYYIPVRGVGQTVSEDDIRKHLGPIFANERIGKCGQNVKYDVIMLKTIDIEVKGIDFDTMLASFVLDSSRRSHGLDALAMEQLNFRKIPTTDLIGKGKNQTTFDTLPTDRVCEYAVEDADISWRLRQTFQRQMTDPGLTSLFNTLEMPLLEVLAQMEFLGVAIDTDRLARLSGEMADKLRELEQDIFEAAGRPFNINSTKQLGEVLFDERNLRVVKKTKTTRSTDAEVLATLASETADPIPPLVLQHRELSKLKGTYIDSLPEMVCQRTGRIHPSFRQTGTVTGRLSCSDPNLQNIPIRTPAGAQIRRAFIPGQDDWVLLKADYSQIELRVLAHFSKDEALAEAFRNDRDIHAFVAAQLSDVPLEKVTKEQRSQAKTVNFGIVYGQSAFGLSRQTGMPLGEARRFIEQYFARYPKIRGFLDDCIAQAKRRGYAETILGRRRTIPDINSRNQTARQAAERLAANSVIQGSAADLIKRAMINIHQRIKDEKRPSRMLIQVHDELVFEIPKDHVKEEAEMIAHEMSIAIKLDVPVKVDVGWGPNWLDLE